MYENDYFFMRIFKERSADYHVEAAQRRLEKLCGGGGQRGPFERIVCMLAHRMIATGVSLLARYGDTSDSAESVEPVMRRRRAI
jgi:hypothetical protein